MLEQGDAVPVDAIVWTSSGEPTALGEELRGDELVLLCFYPFDWSPG